MTLAEYLQKQEEHSDYRRDHPYPEDAPQWPKTEDVDDPLITELLALFDRIYTAVGTDDPESRFSGVIAQAVDVARDQWYARQKAIAQKVAREQFSARMVESLEPALRASIQRYDRDDIKAYVLAMLDYQEEFDDRPAKP